MIVSLYFITKFYQILILILSLHYKDILANIRRRLLRHYNTKSSQKIRLQSLCHCNTNSAL